MNGDFSSGGKAIREFTDDKIAAYFDSNPEVKRAMVLIDGEHGTFEPTIYTMSEWAKWAEEQRKASWVNGHFPGNPLGCEVWMANGEVKWDSAPKTWRYVINIIKEDR